MVSLDLAPGARFPLGQGHALIAGRTGAGKSTALNSLLVSASLHSDVCLLGVDLKLVELSLWRERFDCIASSRSGAVRLLSVVRTLIDARSQTLTNSNLRSWDSNLGPWVLLVIDELAEVLIGAKADKDIIAECESLLDSISRLGRAFGISLVCCTQRPSVEVLGGSLRDQLGYRFGLAVSDQNTSRLITQGVPVDLTTADDLGIGWGYWLEPGKWPHYTRPPFYTEDQIQVISRETAIYRQIRGSNQ